MPERNESLSYNHMDDVYNFELSNDENNIYWIADNFKDFIGLLGDIDI